MSGNYYKHRGSALRNQDQGTINIQTMLKSTNLKKASRLVRHYQKRGFVVGCEDEATFGLLPIIQRGWARKGSSPVVKINSKNKCTNVFGARSKRSFVFTFSKRKKQRDFIRFSEKLLGR